MAGKTVKSSGDTVIMQDGLGYQPIEPIFSPSSRYLGWNYTFDDKGNSYDYHPSTYVQSTFAKGNNTYASPQEGFANYLELMQKGQKPLPVFQVVGANGRPQFYRITGTYNGPIEAVTEEPVKQQATTQRPAQRPATRPSTQKQRLPISSMPANVQQYVDHVDANGNVFFTLPEGVSSDQFDEVLKSMQQPTTPMPLYESTPAKAQQSQEQSQSATETNSTNQNNSNNDAVRTRGSVKKLVETEPVESVGDRYQLYAYPNPTVDVYNIHPDVYAKVLEQLQQNRNSGGQSQTDRYIVSTKPLASNNGVLNDSVYHYIGNNMKDLWLAVPAMHNPNYFGNNDTVYIDQTYVELPQGVKYVTGVTTTDGHTVYPLYGVQDGPTVGLPINGVARRVIRTPYDEDEYKLPLHVLQSISRDVNSGYYGLTPEQIQARHLTMWRDAMHADQEDVPMQEWVSSISASNYLGKLQSPKQQPTEQRQNVFQRIGNIFRHQHGGKINYLEFFRK